MEKLSNQIEKLNRKKITDEKANFEFFLFTVSSIINGEIILQNILENALNWNDYFPNKTQVSLNISFSSRFAKKLKWLSKSIFLEIKISSED